MPIPNEPIGTAPRIAPPIEAIARQCDDPSLTPLHGEATRDTIRRYGVTELPAVSGSGPRPRHDFRTHGDREADRSRHGRILQPRMPGTGSSRTTEVAA